MSIRDRILALSFVALLPTVVTAEPVCTFDNSGHRLISGDNPSDFRCIKLLAAAGDEFQQYYLGLILIGQVPGPKNVPEGLGILKEVALRSNKFSAQAMRFIGEVYKRPNSPLQNDELAYQWLYLASQQPAFKGVAFPLPDEKLSEVISPRRMKELERNAQRLLQNR